MFFFKSIWVILNSNYRVSRTKGRKKYLQFFTTALFRSITQLKNLWYLEIEATAKHGRNTFNLLRFRV